MLRQLSFFFMFTMVSAAGYNPLALVFSLTVNTTILEFIL
jgi:hypothetical protein